MSDSISLVIYLAINKSQHSVVHGLEGTPSTTYRSMKEIPVRELSDLRDV